MSDKSISLKEFKKDFDCFIREEKDAGQGLKPGIFINAYTGSDETVVVPQKVDEYVVQNINSFGECPTVKSVSIPTRVKFDYDAFDNCPKMIGDDGTLIVNGILLKIAANDSILHIPEGVVEIGRDLIGAGPIAENTTIEELIIPVGVKKIGESAFTYCTSLRKISFPESLLTIDGKAFESCKALEEIILPAGLKRVGKYAFRFCENLERVNISPDTKCTGSFDGCHPGADGFLIVQGVLYSVDCSRSDCIDVPANVHTISGYSFNDQSAVIHQLTITDNIRKIDGYAFFVRGIETFRLVNHINNQTIFETDASELYENTLYEKTKFDKICSLITKKRFNELASFGHVYEENIPD